MSLSRSIYRIVQLDHLIRTKATGNPEALARKLGISRSAWFELRNQLVREYNFPIAWDAHRGSYCYTQEGRFVFGFVLKQ